MSENKYWNIIEEAEIFVMKWAENQGTPLYKIEYVATFEKWDNGIGVYIFFESEEEKYKAQNINFFERIKQYYLSILKELKYPFNKFPEIIFFYDSDENVKKNYEGTYFYRLR
jgi:hypothetical protein